MPFPAPRLTNKGLLRLSVLLLVCGFSANALLSQGPGGPSAPDIELLEKFDQDKSGALDVEERAEAREWLKSQKGTRGGPGRRGPGGPRGNQASAGSPGPELDPSQVESFTDKHLYDPSVLRTIFLEFESDEWEQELADFKPTDVEIPATMIVDGKTYPQVGVSFRGASSFFMIPAGSKRSLNLSVDFVDEDQRLYGYKSLNLLNCNGDSTMMSSYLYHDITSKKIAAPMVNFVKVVINGRSWGVYANAQQFNKDFLKDNYKSKKGARWKVNGSPNGDGGLRYLGEDLQDYRERFEIKSKEDEDAWKDLVKLCRVLNETPADQLETALAPMLDIDGALWFLAVDVALVNSDGYWTRASDYSIYQNKDGVFHMLPHDMNEAFRGSRGGGGPGGPGRGGPGGGPRGGPGGPGFGFGFGGGPPNGDGPPPGAAPPSRENGPERGFGGRGPGGPGGERGGPGGGRGGRGGRGGPGGGAQGGFELDPLVGLDDPRFPLRSKLLANENLKQRYLGYVRTIAAEHLNWDYLGKKVASARELISEDIKADTRKLMSDEAFFAATDDAKGSLREFADKRSAYLLNLPAIKALPAD
ncbi:MAG: CotH kinase family protein [Rubripirellula sp.]